jgi:hypothetical protein
MIVNKYKLRKQYGLGLKYYQQEGGGPIFDKIKRYGFPALKWLYRRILKPAVKNNLPEIAQLAKNVISKHPTKPNIKQVIQTIKEDPVLNKITEKSLADHFRGEGLSKSTRRACLNKQSKNAIKKLSGGGLKILK